MEFYRFSLSPADRKSTINFKEMEDNHHLLTTAANNCNIGVSFKRDGKKLIIEEITDSTILLTLSAITALHSPARTLSAYSRELIRIDKATCLLSSSIYNHTLFNTQLLDNIPSKKISVDQISDSELLKAIIDLLFSASEKYDLASKSNAINQLKEIMLPYMK